MADPRRYDPRRFLGFTGSPLPLAEENVPVSQGMRERFERQGQSAFLPYVDPWATLAGAAQYQRTEQDLQVAEAENNFFNELPNLTTPDPRQNQGALMDFLNRNPAGVLSPMVEVYRRRMQPSTQKDPFESTIAREGSEYLEAYRKAVALGQDPTQAFSEFRDVINTKKAAEKQTKDDEYFFVEKGGDLADFPALKEKGASRAAMLDFINKKGKPLTVTESKKLAELQEEMDAAERSLTYDNEKDYEKDVIAVYGRKPSTEKEWEEAYFKLKESKIGPKAKAYDDYVTILSENNKRIPQRAAGNAGAPPPFPSPVAAPIATPPPATSPFDGGPAAPAPKPGTSPLKEVKQRLKP